MAILEELWYGNLDPAAQYADGDKEYFAAAKAVVNLEDKVKGEISGAALKWFDELSEKRMQFSSLDEKAAYIAGVRFGVQFILDALGRSS